MKLDRSNVKILNAELYVELHKRVKMSAVQQERTVREIVTEALEMYLEKQEVSQ